MTRSNGSRSVALSDIVELRNGINFGAARAGESIRIVGVGDFGKQETISDFSNLRTVVPGSPLRPDDYLRDGDLLFVRSNGSKALVGRCALIADVDRPVTFSGFTIRARIRDTAEVDARYLSKVMRSDAFASHLRQLGGGSSISNLSQRAISSFELVLPPLGEQRKIAEVLGTWDEAIALQRSLAARYRDEYLALVNGMLTPIEANHPGEHGILLADATRELDRRNIDRGFDASSVMGVSNDRGLFPMRPATMAGDLSRYKILPPRAFAYNPMRINVGSIAMSELAEEVLVSPDYVLFECRQDVLLPEYFRHILNTEWWSHQVRAGGSGSVRSRAYYGDLASLHLTLPELDRQRILHRLMDAGLQTADLAADSVSLVEKQKRALVRKLVGRQSSVAGSNGRKADDE